MIPFFIFFFMLFVFLNFVSHTEYIFYICWPTGSSIHFMQKMQDIMYWIFKQDIIKKKKKNH